MNQTLTKLAKTLPKDKQSTCNVKPRVVGPGQALLAMVPRSLEPAYTDMGLRLGLRSLYYLVVGLYFTTTPPMQLMRTVTEPGGANATSRLCLNAIGDRDIDVNP